MTDRINLNAEEAREFNETGRVELWTELDPQPEGIESCLLSKDGFAIFIKGPNKTRIDFPHGPDGERWVAEIWRFVGWDRHEGEIIIQVINCKPERIGIDDDERYIELEENAGDQATSEGYELDYFQLYSEADDLELTWQPALTMPREASRANANITTTVKQRDGVWGFVTVVERKVENA